MGQGLVSELPSIQARVVGGWERMVYLYSDELLLSGLAVRPLLPKAEEDFKWWWGVGLTLLEHDELCSKNETLSQKREPRPRIRGGLEELDGGLTIEKMLQAEEFGPDLPLNGVGVRAVG